MLPVEGAGSAAGCSTVTCGCGVSWSRIASGDDATVLDDFVGAFPSDSRFACMSAPALGDADAAALGARSDSPARRMSSSASDETTTSTPMRVLAARVHDLFCGASAASAIMGVASFSVAGDRTSSRRS
jgi:hypothetical protein